MGSIEIHAICTFKKNIKITLGFFWHLLSLLLANWLVPILISCGTVSGSYFLSVFTGL